MTESKKKSIDLDDNDISRSELSNNLDDTSKRKESYQNFVQIQQHRDEEAAEKYAPVQLQHNIKQSFQNQKQIAKKLQNDNTKNQETQTSDKFDSIIQNQNQIPAVIQDQVQVNQFYYPNHQDNLIYQPVYYVHVPLSQSVLHRPPQRAYCTPCLKILMFLLFLIIGAGLTFFIIQKIRKVQVSSKKVIPPIKQLSKTTLVVPPVSQKQKPKLQYESPQNYVSTQNQTSETLSSIQNTNRSFLQPKINHRINKQQNNTQSKNTQKFILSKGNKLFCRSNQLLVNGNCLSCGFGEQWFGLQCIKQPILYKHVHLVRKESY